MSDADVNIEGGNEMANKFRFNRNRHDAIKQQI